MRHSATPRGALAWLVAALVLAGCGDMKSLTSPADAPPPAFEIVDAVHGGGNAHFFFLPPLAEDPVVTGVFDATLEPVVQICEWTGTACTLPLVAEFTTTAGPGSESVRMVPEDEAYLVNWHTGRFALDEGATYRITVLVGWQQLGHADVVLVGSGRRQRGVATDGFVAVKDGRTLPVRFRIEEGAMRSGGILVDRNHEGQDPANLDIFTMSSDGAEFTQLTDHPCADQNGDWSPDRARIAFASYRTPIPGVCSRTTDIFVMNADGTGITRLTDDPANDWHATWSPDGTRIAFSSQRGGLNGEIYVMNADGSGLKRVTNSGASWRQSFQPVWSPDGTRIAFSSDALSYPNVHQIFVVDASVTEAPPSFWTRITNNDERDLIAQWSSDGTRISFIRGHRWYSDHDVYVMNADGSGATNLSNDPNRYDSFPSWSPDGSEMVWTKRGSDGYWQVWKMNADGTNPVQLTFDEPYVAVTSWR